MNPKQELSLTAEVDRRFDELFGEVDDDADLALTARPQLRASSTMTDLKSAVLAVDWEITDEIMDRFSEAVGKARETFQDRKPAQTLLRLLDSLARYIRRRKSGAHPDSITRLHSIFEALEWIAGADGLSEVEITRRVNREVAGFRGLKKKISGRHATMEEGGGEGGKPAGGFIKPPTRAEEPVGHPLEETLPYKDVGEIIGRSELLKDANQTEPSAMEAEAGEEEASGLKETREGEIEEAAVRVLEAEKEAAEDGEAAEPAGEDGMEVGLDLDLDDIEPPDDIADMTPHEAFAYALDEIREVIRSEFRALRAELRLMRKGR